MVTSAAAESGPRAQGYFTGLFALLAARPGRLEFAFRLALICALTALVTAVYQTPEPALAVYIVFFLNRGDRTTSVIMNIALTIVITVVIGFVFLVARLVADDAMWRVISIALLSFGLLFLASASKLRPVASTLALIVGFALDELGMVQVGEEATRGFLYAWLFVGIPAGVSLIVNLLLGPAPRRLAEKELARRLELAAGVLRGADEGQRCRLRECSREGAEPILEHLKLAGVERAATPQDLLALRQAAYSSVALLSAVDIVDRDPAADLPRGVRERVALVLEEMAGIFRDGGYPVDVELPGSAGAVEEGGAAGVAEAGRTLEAARVAMPPLAAKAFDAIRDAVVHFAVPPGEATAPPEEKGGFFAKDAFTNLEHVHYALKTTAAAVFCYLLYSLLDWPGIHTCFLTCYIVSLGTTAESVEKLSLRIAGCLIGAAAGIAAIVYLVPSLTSIGGLLATVFLAALASGYVAAGSERISYAGFQIAFAFFLCVIQGAGPSFDMVTARDRVIGILVGIFVVYFLFTHLWPVSVCRRIDPAIASVLKRLGALAKTADSRERRVLASEIQASIAAVETDIDLARYEPLPMRPDASWVQARRAAVTEIGELVELLLLGADEGSLGRLRRLEEGLADKGAVVGEPARHAEA
jgi:multidrug resistance protein MdtO